jgi:peptidoglycan/xylan/chitin deacetylase (PgdA/CDA1 family)
MGLNRTIRNGMGWLLAVALVTTGRLKAARKRAFQANVITPVAFHNPSRKLFQKIVGWLNRNGFVFISTDQLLRILCKDIPCPRGAVWISLDDGWKDNLNNVIPVATHNDIPITIFIYTGAIESGSFWWRIKRASSLPNEALTEDDIKRIATLYQVTLGAHTVTHPVLPECPEKRVVDEIRNSQKKLEDWTGKPVITFAYPKGRYDGRERKYLEQLSFSLAVTTASGFGTPDTDHYLFPRNIVMDDGTFLENLCHVLGIWEPIVQSIKRIIGIRPPGLNPP